MVGDSRERTGAPRRGERLEAERPSRTRLVWRELVGAQRPTAVDDPRPRLEVNSLERHAEAAAPAGGRALDAPPPTVEEVAPVALQDGAVGDPAIQLLGGGILVQPAAVGEDHARARAHEVTTHGDAGGPGADHAHVGFHRARRRRTAGALRFRLRRLLVARRVSPLADRHRVSGDARPELLPLRPAEPPAGVDLPAMAEHAGWADRE